MAFALILIGLVLVIASARGTLGDLAAILKSEFSGPGNFFYWILAIIIVGSLGYIKGGKTFSHMFLALILFAMILSNRGIFANFMTALSSIQPNENAGSGTAAGNTVAPTPAPQNPGSGANAGSGKSSDVSPGASPWQKYKDSFKNILSPTGNPVADTIIGGLFGGLF